MLNQHHSLAVCLCMTALMGTQCYAEIIYSDNAGYNNVQAAQNVWKHSSVGLTSSVTTAGQPAVTPASGQCLTLNNNYTYMDLPKTLTGDWSLTALVLAPDWGRKINIGLTNAAGTQGYFASWDSSSAGSYSGNGIARIYKYSSASTLASANPSMTQLGTNASGNHPALGYVVTGSNPTTYNPTFQGLALLELDWSAADQKLTLKMDGVTLRTIQDTTDPLTSFSRIYLTAYGSGATIFDSITVSSPVPEATSLGILGGAAGTMLLTRRR